MATLTGEQGRLTVFKVDKAEAPDLKEKAVEVINRPLLASKKGAAFPQSTDLGHSDSEYYTSDQSLANALGMHADSPRKQEEIQVPGTTGQVHTGSPHMPEEIEPPKALQQRPDPNPQGDHPSSQRTSPEPIILDNGLGPGWEFIDPNSEANIFAQAYTALNEPSKRGRRGGRGQGGPGS